MNEEQEISKFLQEWECDGFTVQDVHIEKECADLMAQGILKILNRWLEPPNKPPQ